MICPGAPRGVCLLVAILLAWWCTPAAAHLTPNSEIGLAVGANGVDADIIIPQGEYGFATRNPIGNYPQALMRAREYIERHFSVCDHDGRPWRIDLDKVEFVQIAGPPDLHATARLSPPSGASSRRFRIRWTALLEEMPSHFALFVLASDSEGMVGDGREVLGAVRAGDTILEVDRGKSSARVAFANAVLLGIGHIIGGYDHLLFLLALLLPAPMIARAGRWAEPRPIRETVTQLLKIVTAFTIGHSLTLIGATLGGWHLAAAPVEIAIAVSVLVSAVHAIRPLVPGREHYVAIGFGLVHGLAFATLLHDVRAGTASTAVTLIGFNLGIETVQICIVTLVIPPLLVLSRAPIFAMLRTVLAALTAGAATAWILNRSFGLGDGLVAGVDEIVSHGLWAVAMLYLLSVPQAVRMWSRPASRASLA